mmetsp:Transcript_18697/g.33931  ORF Transcript_18697/g.33931 Transcript_18697/m.33931 type:complete len:355 (-) Transcript_18697:661-1725(-)
MVEDPDYESIDDGEDNFQSNEVNEDDHAALDIEADDLFKELAESQLEVRRLIAEQKEEASQLVEVKDQISNELLQLQDEAWKLQIYAELEMLKRQLAAVGTLEENLDNVEALLSEYELQESERSKQKESIDSSTIGKPSLNSFHITDFDVELMKEGSEVEGEEDDEVEVKGKNDREEMKKSEAKYHDVEGINIKGTTEMMKNGSEDDEEDITSSIFNLALSPSQKALSEQDDMKEEDLENLTPEGIDAMQKEIDEELKRMFAQLQAVKGEAAIVAARKLALEEELLNLLADGGEDDEGEEGVDEEEEKKREMEEEEEGGKEGEKEEGETEKKEEELEKEKELENNQEEIKEEEY